MNRIFLRPESFVEPYPLRWQEACRQLVQLYCDLPDNRQPNGKPMGMTAFRDEVMEDFDAREQGKRIRQRWLGREELESWIRGKTNLSPPKFQYIDRWVRLNYRKNMENGLYESVIEAKEHSHCAMLEELYARHDTEYDAAPILTLTGCLALSPVLLAPHASEARYFSRYSHLSDFRQFAIYFRSTSQRSALITVVYFDQPFSELRPDVEGKAWAACFGYVVFTGSEEGINHTYNGVLHLFRGAVPGHEWSGTSVSRLTFWSLEREFLTDWFPQIGTQSITQGNSVEPPIVEDTGSSAVARGRYRMVEVSAANMELTTFMKILTNGYLLW